MSKTDKILEVINDQPITISKIAEATELPQSLVSGILAALLRRNIIEREKVERISGTGPKMQWAYKKSSQTEKVVVESPVE